MDRAPDWDAHQSAIQRLYWNERKELPEVIRIMEAEYNFVATRKQYKKQLKSWGYEKNIKAHEMKAMLQIQKRRLEEGGKETRFMRRGLEVPPEKLARFRKRYKITQRDEASIIPSERAATPDGIEYGTPEPEPLQSPFSDTSNRSAGPSDDLSLDAEGDSNMLPAPLSGQAPLYAGTEQAWINVNDPFSYAQVSPTGFSGMTIEATPHSPSAFHATPTRNSYSGPLSPAAFLAQTSNNPFGHNSDTRHDLANMDDSWNFGYFPHNARLSVPASRPLSDAPGEQCYSYPAGPSTQVNMSWMDSCDSGQVTSSKHQDDSSRQVSSVADTYPVRDEGVVASSSKRAIGDYNTTQGISAAFRNCTPLHRAIIKGDIERAKILLKRGDTDPNPVAFGGISPLHCAAFLRNVNLIRLLREYGAKLDATTNYDQSILFFAVCSPDRLKGGERAANSLKALRDLPVTRSDENTVDTINALYDCPLGWACLLRIVDKADCDGITPLMAAAEEGFVRTATLLLQRGARPEKKDKASYTALKYAASCSRPDLVRLLLDADTRIQDRDLSHMLKLVTRTLLTARPDTDRGIDGSQSYLTQPRGSACYEGSTAVLEEIAQVYRKMGVLDKLISLAKQQQQSPRVMEYLSSAVKAKDRLPR